MKLLLLIIMMIPNVVFATASATATVATTTQPQSLQDMINSALFAIVSAMMVFLTNYCKNYLIQKTKEAQHVRGTAVVGDGFYSAIADTNVDIDVTLSDKTAKEVFMLNWNTISVSRLNDLSGFNKKDMVGWVKVQQGIFLGRYLENKK